MSKPSRATRSMRNALREHRVVIDDFAGFELEVIPVKNNKLEAVKEGNLGLKAKAGTSKPFMVNIGFGTKTTTMPKASREKPRVLIDEFIGWDWEVLDGSNPGPRPVTILEQHHVAPEYDWSKLMPPTKLVEGELVVEPGWEFKPQYFHAWVYTLRDYLLITEWLDIEAAAADNGFEILLEKGKGIERWYIFAAVEPNPEDPCTFPKAIRFCELLATTNIPPSVAIDILYGRLKHSYLPIGCQPGGFCLKYNIPHDTFLERYKRFISHTKDLVNTLPGVSLYLTGSTISVVTKPELQHQLEMVVVFAEHCILRNGDIFDIEEPSESKKLEYDRYIVNKQLESSSLEGSLKEKLSKKKRSNDVEPLKKKQSKKSCVDRISDDLKRADLGSPSETRLPRNLVVDLHIGWHEDIFITPEKNEVNPFLDQKSIAPDYDWSKLMPPSEQGLEFKPQHFLIVVYPLRDYVLANHWHDIQCAAEDNGFGIALKMARFVDVCYITMATQPSTAKDLCDFPKATRFCELLATTNVPPPVAIQILNGDLIHKYVPIGRQQGGLCLKHEIPQATFRQRYWLFLNYIKDLVVSYGLLLYLAGNTITVVGKPKLGQVMDKVIDYAKRFILHGEERPKTRGRN